jgi:hypothetical protein
VVLPKDLKVVDDFVFGICESFTEIVIPDGVTTIGIGAFSYCENLARIKIPKSVTSVEYVAFYNCNNLNEDIRQEILERFGVDVFKDVQDLI